MAETIYSLERRNWRQARGLWLSLPGSDRVGTFHDRGEADAEAREREWSVRRRVNPFKCGGPLLHYQTTFDAARLFDWCMDASLDPPGQTNDSRIWADWWAVNHEEMTLAQRASVWEALDRVRFFHVRECERGIPCHLVATQYAAYDRMTRNWAIVGCAPTFLSPNPNTADSLCRQIFLDHLASTGSYVGDTLPPPSWEAQVVDPFDESSESRDAFATYEFPETRRFPIELFSQRPIRPGQTAYVVLRRHWLGELGEDGSWRLALADSKSCGWPIAVFDTLTAADACQAKLEADARRWPFPFRFGTPHEWSNLQTNQLWGMLVKLGKIDFASVWTDFTAPDFLWCRWWDSVVPTLRQEEIDLVWSLYDRLRFYEITEAEYRE